MVLLNGTDMALSDHPLSGGAALFIGFIKGEYRWKQDLYLSSFWFAFCYPHFTDAEKKTIPAKQVLVPEKYTGIHNVVGKPETISPDGTWTIDVPAGLSYTMDPKCAGKSMMGASYPLQIQTTADCDFSSAYDSKLFNKFISHNLIFCFF